MSIWRINKRGISLNENGKWITFCFIKLFEKDKRGQWLFRFYIRSPFSKCAWTFETFIRTMKRIYRKF